ncbi:NEW3 domain-containing protein [Haloarchaeobius sp. HME9146]|uniref:DUF7490 domain-containing protein n=1 Tax=Haloarchaeobius sp. HME9146 TaxID=2978732 RepID=UPI0021C16D77|nr:NEW3 domain-containing protein [Haloarchaeobius sp. HME9146]MCT9094557.1 NEW3 domain-containing protein [Haloarchaeobius sp. HME9146]
MKPETGLAAVVVVALLVTAGVLVAVPGALQPPPDDEPVERPGRVALTEMTISAGQVTGGTATLQVTPYVEHRGNPAPNVTVVLRAVDTDSGLVEATTRLAFGDLRNESELNRTGRLSVPREGGYRVEAVLYRDGERMTVGSRTVSGVDSLTPAYAETPVGFHEFDGDAELPVIEYRVASVENDRATLAVTTYLTNTGDDPAENLRFVLKARQNGSNVVADQTTVQVGSVAPGETVTPTADLTVPDGYNYYLDAILWKGDTIVGTERSVANLAPGQGLTVNWTQSAAGFESGDFETGDGPATGPPTTASPEADAGGQPGFGLPAAFVAVLVTALVARRVRR